MSECNPNRCDQGVDPDTDPDAKRFISPVDLRDIGVAEDVGIPAGFPGKT
jgi:hypothetical protein